MGDLGSSTGPQKASVRALEGLVGLARPKRYLPLLGRFLTLNHGKLQVSSRVRVLLTGTGPALSFAPVILYRIPQMAVPSLKSLTNNAYLFCQA